MKYDQFRRSDNVDDYRDPGKPITPEDKLVEGQSINERMKIVNSVLAHDAGADDIAKLKEAGNADQGSVTKGSGAHGNEQIQEGDPSQRQQDWPQSEKP